MNASLFILFMERAKLYFVVEILALVDQWPKLLNAVVQWLMFLLFCQWKMH